ncbi:MAG: hypothetical protein ACI9RU_002615 [Litorivivens sp.]|jgi:uncharacterized protein (DUF58 family)
METSELLKKVRAIEIKSRGLSNQIFSGEYHSAFKGRGMAFSENREYQHGDEIKTIDWNVTARMGHPYVKVFEEERELTAMILVDVSGSEQFGTKGQLKRSLIAELAAVLAFSAIQNNDKIGVLFFSDKIEKFIPPKKGKSHILRIIRELINFEAESSGTDIRLALDYLNSVIKKRSICFLVSDFEDQGFEDALKIANKKHDMVALRIQDPAEQVLPNIGLVQIKDSETGEVQWVNTSSKSVRQKFAKNRAIQNAELKGLFRKSGVDFASINTNENYVRPLMNLFKQRS